MNKIIHPGKKILALLLAGTLSMTPVYAATVTSSSNGQTYTSTQGADNAVFVSGNSVTLSSPAITKTGGENSENADFYGTNAAVLATNGGSITITGGTVKTNGSHANALFAYGSGSSISATGTTVTTTSNNSGGIMVTGGGSLTAKNLTVTTSGGSSAPIRSDRGGGTMKVTGGTYTSNGAGSPAIYSTADITVNGANLVSNASEGLIIEGKNSISLQNCKVVDSNTVLNGKSTTYKNIFLYQSMSGDASVGTASFSAEGSSFTTKKGDVFYITNTTASITLKGNTFQNSSDGILLRAEAGPWGNSGSNGGKVTLTATSQALEGNIVVDSVSSLDMTLGNGSSYTGAINTNGKGGTVRVTLKDGATWTLTGDSYISSFTGSEENIQKNGYTLTISGEASGSDGSSQDGTTPGGNTPSGDGNWPTPPAMPGGGNQGSDGSQMPTPPAMPGGDNQSGDGSQMPTPPAMPGGDNQGSDGSQEPTPTPAASQGQSSETISVGTRLQDNAGNIYKVAKVGTAKKNGSVVFLSPSGTDIETVTIPASVKLSGITYKVTAIAANAFNGCSALKSATIGKNVLTIGKKAFAGCSNLSSLAIKTKSLAAGKIQKNAFQGTSAAITVTVPKAQLKLYKKILTNKGISKSAKWKTA